MMMSVPRYTCSGTCTCTLLLFDSTNIGASQSYCIIISIIIIVIIFIIINIISIIIQIMNAYEFNSVNIFLSWKFNILFNTADALLNSLTLIFQRMNIFALVNEWKTFIICFIQHRSRLKLESGFLDYMQIAFTSDARS